MQKAPVLLLDNFDSFTYNLVDYLAQAGICCEVHRNNEPFSSFKQRPYLGVLLSPGPEQPSKAGSLMEVLDYYSDKLPILGVCLGHQAIGEFFGWELTKAIRPMHGKISPVMHNGHGVFRGVPSPFEVVRYHSLVLQSPKVDGVLKGTAFTEEGEVMGVCHQALPIAGIQFHPEAALTQHGHRLIENWAASLVKGKG